MSSIDDAVARCKDFIGCVNEEIAFVKKEGFIEAVHFYYDLLLPNVPKSKKKSEIAREVSYGTLSFKA